MLIHKNSLRSRSKRRRRKRSKFITPDLSLVHGQLLHFVANEDSPLSAAERLGEEYAAMADDHDAAVGQFLQRAYFVVVQFWRRPYEFERLQVHPFWKQSGQPQPRDPKTSKSVLCFLMQATTTDQRHLASKYAVILDGLQQDQVEIDAVAARIQELGGVDAAYEAMRLRKRGDVQVSGTVAETAAAGRRARRDDECSSRKIGESVMPTKHTWRRPKPTLRPYPLVAPPFAEEKTQPYDDGDENKIVWGEDAFGFVQRLAREYAEIKDGDHQAVRRLLQRAYLAVREMRRQPDELKRLQDDRFWKPPWRSANSEAIRPGIPI
jgi:hypothetical protein